MNILEVDSVNLSFGATQILRNLSLAVEEGDRHAIIGPNGAGKSTLFNVVSGMYAPQSGTVTLDGERISGLGSHHVARRGLSRSFQISAIFASMSVFENVRISVMAARKMRFSLNQFAHRNASLTAETEKLLQLVGLDRVAEKSAGDLTYSEQRALEVAMTLGPDPRLMLLDEPTAGMSGDESARFVALLQQVTVGRTLLVVEHDMEVVFTLCNRISVLVNGEVIATGAPDEIRSNPRVQDAYLGVEAAEADA